MVSLKDMSNAVETFKRLFSSISDVNPPSIENKNQSKIAKQSSSTPGKMIFIADTEGCEFSSYLCDDDTFTQIQGFLKENDQNEITFLGDYFDHGDGVVTSINRMIELKTEYGDRVTILLGNRDINKLRFCFELQDAVATNQPGENKSFWNKDVHNKLVAKIDTFEKIQVILNSTMGASTDDHDPTKKNYNENSDSLLIHKLPISVDNVTAQKIGAYYLIFAFDPIAAKTIIDIDSISIDENTKLELTKFSENVKKLFFENNVGELAKYNPKFHSFSAHGSGLDTFMFQIKGLSTLVSTLPNYYEKIEDIRNQIQSESETLTNVDTITEFVAEYQNILTQFRQQMVKENNQFPIPKIPSTYFLLQALALAPKPNAKGFRSIIAVGDLEGVGGPKKTDLTDIYSKLVNNNVTFVAFGHKPCGIPIPLIYKRKDRTDKPIILISNDSSTSRFKSLKNPIAYITTDFKVGCGVLNNNTITPVIKLEDVILPNITPMDEEEIDGKKYTFTNYLSFMYNNLEPHNVPGLTLHETDSNGNPKKYYTITSDTKTLSWENPKNIKYNPPQIVDAISEPMSTSEIVGGTRKYHNTLKKTLRRRRHNVLKKSKSSKRRQRSRKI